MRSGFARDYCCLLGGAGAGPDSAAKGCRNAQGLCRRRARNRRERRGRAGRGLLAALAAHGLFRGRQRGGFPALALLGTRRAGASADVLRPGHRALCRCAGEGAAMDGAATRRSRQASGLKPLQPWPIYPSRPSPATSLPARFRALRDISERRISRPGRYGRADGLCRRGIRRGPRRTAACRKPHRPSPVARASARSRGR